MDKKLLNIATHVPAVKVEAFFKKVPGSIAKPKEKVIPPATEWPTPRMPLVKKDVSVQPNNPLVQKMEPAKKKRKPKDIVLPKTAIEPVESFKTAEQLSEIGIMVEMEPTIIEANYHTFSNRVGPACLHPRPEPIPHTLESFVFVITGVLETMEREEAVQYIRECGGSVTNGVAKKTTHALVGHSCGPSKIADIQKRGLVMLSETSLAMLVAHLNQAKSRMSALPSTTERVSGDTNLTTISKLDVALSDEIAHDATMAICPGGHVSDPEFDVSDD